MSKNFVFTAFDIDDIPELPQGATYLVYQWEKCPETDRIHMQGFIQTSKAIRFSGVKKILGSNTVHIEKMYGTAEEARSYCLKEDTRFKIGNEFGTMTYQGKRVDLERVAQMALNGDSIETIAAEQPAAVIRYLTNINKLRLTNYKHRLSKPAVYIFYGKSGVGKTRKVYDTGKSIYSKMTDNRWWDGYEQQDIILLDDYNGYLPFRYLLQLLDRYPMLVEVKGGTIPVNSDIYITSDRHPRQWYPSLSEDEYAQLARRIDNILLLE